MALELMTVPKLVNGVIVPVSLLAAALISGRTCFSQQPCELLIEFCERNHDKFSQLLLSGGTAERLLLQHPASGEVRGGFHRVKFLGLQTHVTTFRLSEPPSESDITEWQSGAMLPHKSNFTSLLVSNPMYRFVLTGNAGSDTLQIELLHLRRHPSMRFEASALAGSFARFRAGRSFLDTARDPGTEIATWTDDWLNGVRVKVAKISTPFFVPGGGQALPGVEIVFFDAELGHCLQVIYEDDYGRQKDVFEYEHKVDGIPVVTRVLGFDEMDGHWILRREERFREIRFGQEVDKEIFTLSYYGFPEPAVDRSPSPRRWFLALAAGAALLALGWAIRSIAKSSRFAESKPKQHQGT